MAQQRKPSRGRGGAKMVVWWVFAAMIIVALWRGMGVSNVSELIDYFRKQEADISKVMTNFGDKVTETVDKATKETGSKNGDASTPDTATHPATTSSAPSQASETSSSDSSAASAAYNRDEWRHWVNVRGCWTVREAVLARDAEPGSLVMADGDGRRTTNQDEACTITAGTWVDPYTGATIIDPRKLDIDHLVPLAEAARSGGQRWDAQRKQDYANNMSDPHHLLAVSASANRAKGDKDPANWMPDRTGYWCEYVNAWVGVKDRWGLTFDKAERRRVDDILATC